MTSALLRLLLLRLVLMAPTAFVVVLIGYVLLVFSPGDAVDAYLAQTGGDEGFAARLRRDYGLDGSALMRLFRYIGLVLQGDFGQSLIYQRPVTALVGERLPNTLLLMAGALGVALLVGLGLGLLSGLRPQSVLDRLASAVSLLLFALPNFWAALLLILVFAVLYPLLPVSGATTPAHFILPSLALGLGYAALYARSLRAGMTTAWLHPMVRAARARGLPEPAIVWRTILRPNAAPMLSIGAQNISTLIGGSIVIETMFAIPGLGLLATEAVSGRDPVLLMGLLVTVSIMVMLVQLAADLLILVLDPRRPDRDAHV